ncbi:MAG TPA: hypothetical protein VMJ64_01520 [Anaerolineales bacterium]|nr:hypothetical protein [Anaerolineales bacterium]
MKRLLLPALAAASLLIALLPASATGQQMPSALRAVLLVIGLVLLAGVLLHRAGSGIRPHFAALLAAGAVVLIAYLFMATDGTWSRWPVSTDYYDRLARALVSGRLYVKEAPHPALLALANPYDPDARKGIPGLVPEATDTIWDMAMYRGRVYLYWGPVPSILLAPLKAVLPVVVGDQTLTFALLLGAFACSSLILLRLWRHFFSDTPSWTLVGGMLLLAFANPAPWLLLSPRIYEAAIAAGQFFLMGGLYLVISAFDRPSVSNWRLALAALAWVCAAGSRATLAVCVLYLAIAVLLWLSWSQSGFKRPRAAWPTVMWFTVPLLAGALLLAWYNYARFGSVFEFGFRYELTMLDQNRYRAVLFSPIYLRPNAYLYMLNPPDVSSQFPFIRPVWNGDYVRSFNEAVHGIYNAERIIGVMYAAPFLLFGLIVPAVLLARLAGRSGSALNATLASGEPPEHLLDWLLVTLTGLAVLELLLIFLLFYSTMRYFMDAAPTLLILSILGFWLGNRMTASHPGWRIAYTFVGVVLMGYTILMGLLIGFSSDIPRLKATNPALLTHLRLFFTTLARRLGW